MQRQEGCGAKTGGSRQTLVDEDQTLEGTPPQGYIQGYGMDPYVVITHPYGLQGVAGYWMQPMEDGIMVFF